MKEPRGWGSAQQGSRLGVALQTEGLGDGASGRALDCALIDVPVQQTMWRLELLRQVDFLSH